MIDRPSLISWAPRLVLLLFLAGLSIRPARAHEGPPFLIITDHDMGPFVVSVWADPDIGTGTFFVVLEPPKGEELPDDITAKIAVAPTSGRLNMKSYTAEPQPVDYGARFMTEVAFDRGEMWRVRVTVNSAAGGAEAATEVEATPNNSKSAKDYARSILRLPTPTSCVRF